MEPSDLALRQLMAAYQAGSFSAFESLYDVLAPELSRYLGSLTRDRERSADLLQEAFLRIHQARRSYDPAYPFRPWAFAIARHVFLMDGRALSRRLRREAASVTEEAPARDSLFGRRLVQQLMGGFSRECRELLRLRYVLGLDFREIGSRLGLRPGTARVRASRALAELRDRAGARLP